MNKPETRLRSSILKRLNAEWPGYWKHAHGSIYTPGGIPDIFGSSKRIGGRFCGFEVKLLEGGDATPLQQYNLEQIRKSGGLASVVRSYEEVNDILTEVVASRAAARERRSRHD